MIIGSTESFMQTLKCCEVYLKQYQSYQKALENIGELIEKIYNCKRLHSGIGYLPPVEFEAA
jgi:putative transposase